MGNGSLMEALERVKADNPPRLWTHTRKVIMITGIVYGLEFIGSKRFVHRYLKPDNYLLNKNYFYILFDKLPLVLSHSKRWVTEI
jgi:serine/threonine protein kinase